MSVAVVTGSGGLIGSQAARHFTALGLEAIGVDNDMRGQLFGAEGSVAQTIGGLCKVPGYRHVHADIRNPSILRGILAATDVSLVVHCAAQPAHDSPSPMVDWEINAIGTVNVLDAVRDCAPNAVVVVLSTIKVYGQQPNALPLVELETRYDLLPTLSDRTSQLGIDETMSVDGSARSMFGASKLAADIMAQEYGQSLGLRTVILRPGCLTGAAHAAVEAHGFLGHLIRCVATGQIYRVQGDGKLVRDQIHAVDVVSAIEQVWRKPPAPGTVYNLGGGRGTEVSVLEALTLAEEATGRAAKTEHVPARHGDHRWWVTDMAKFRTDYPEWGLTRDLGDIALEIADRWR